MDVSAEVEKAIQDFIPPTGWESIGLEGRKVNIVTIAFWYGVEIRNVLTNDRRWYCQVNGCSYNTSTTSQNVHGSYSHAIQHLHVCHQIRSRRSLKRQSNKDQAYSYKKKYLESSLYRENRRKARQYVIALGVIESMHALRSVDSKISKLMQHIDDVPMNRAILQKRIEELYTAFKDIVTRDIASATRNSTLPVLHLGADKTPILREQHLGITISYYGTDFVLRRILLAFRRYQFDVIIDFLCENEIISKEILLVLGEFNITIDMVYDSTSDAGSDIRCGFQTVLYNEYLSCPMWIWCIPHALQRAALAAKIGIPEIEQLEAVFKETINEIHNSNLREKLRVLQGPDAVKLKKYRTQRWLGFVIAAQRFIQLYYVIERLYQEEGMSFRMDGKLNLLKQLHAVFQGFAKIIKTLGIRRSTTIIGFVECVSLRKQLITSHLSVDGEDVEPFECIQELRAALVHELDKRLWRRYFDIDKSCFTSEVALMLHPNNKSLVVVEELIEMLFNSSEKETTFAQVYSRVKKQLLCLMERVGDCDYRISAEEELASYLSIENTQVASRRDLTYWKKYSDLYPRCTDASMVIYGAQSGADIVEVYFGVGKLVARNRRCSLNFSFRDMLVVLKANFHYMMEHLDWDNIPTVTRPPVHPDVDAFDESYTPPDDDEYSDDEMYSDDDLSSDDEGLMSAFVELK